VQQRHTYTCRISSPLTSVPAFSLARRAWITLEKRALISMRALSRVRWLAVGALGQKKDVGVMPRSRSWYLREVSEAQ